MISRLHVSHVIVIRLHECCIIYVGTRVQETSDSNDVWVFAHPVHLGLRLKAKVQILPCLHERGSEALRFYVVMAPRAKPTTICFLPTTFMTDECHRLTFKIKRVVLMVPLPGCCRACVNGEHELEWSNKPVKLNFNFADRRKYRGNSNGDIMGR